MTIDQFNDKEGKVIILIFIYLNPKFTYAQIKLKFGMARVYLNGLPYKCREIAEDAINEIMKCEL